MQYYQWKELKRADTTKLSIKPMHKESKKIKENEYTNTIGYEHIIWRWEHCPY